MRALRRHLTFANVCSFIALTVALGTAGPTRPVAEWEHWGGGHQAARFYRDAFGVVHLEGLVRERSDSGVARTIFVLPVGRRPAARHVFPVVGSEKPGSAAALGRVDVWPDGRVVLEARPDDNPESAAAHYLSLSGLSFLAG